MDSLSLLLRSPDDWRELVRILLHVVLILAIAGALLALSRRIVPWLRRELTRRTDDPEQIKRLETLARAVRYVASVVIVLITGMLVLSELGVSITPILASAGIVGIAVGFGAQSLIKDYFTGLFLLVENQLHVGDLVEVAGKSGVVEELTLRYIRLRDYEGSVHFVPNNAVVTVTNRSRQYAYAVMDVGVAYRENLDEVFAVMREVAAGLRADETLGSLILEDLDLAGVNAWADSAVVIRARFKVQPLQQHTVRRAFLLRLKQAFDARGIEIPYPHLTLYPGQGKDGKAPPLRVITGLADEASRAAAPENPLQPISHGPEKSS